MSDPLAMPDLTAQYAAGTAAAKTVIDSEIKDYVPAMFQNRIPDDAKQKFAAAVAKAVIDAVVEMNPA